MKNILSAVIDTKIFVGRDQRSGDTRYGDKGDQYDAQMQRGKKLQNGTTQFTTTSSIVGLRLSRANLANSAMMESFDVLD